MVSKETTRRSHRAHPNFDRNFKPGFVIDRVAEGFRVFRREVGPTGYIIEVPVRTFATEPAAERYVAERIGL